VDLMDRARDFKAQPRDSLIVQWGAIASALAAVSSIHQSRRTCQNRHVRDAGMTVAAEKLAEKQWRLHEKATNAGGSVGR
jgi:hypothetical protein